MKQPILLITIIFFSMGSIGQNLSLVDSISNEICKSINASDEQNDSIKITNAFIQHRDIFKKYYPNKLDSIAYKLFFRLQSFCNLFQQFLEKNEPNNAYWSTFYNKPKPLTKLNDEDCNNFFDHKSFTYFEYSGDTVHLQIEDGFWIDHFKDSTTSELKVFKNSNCRFTIEFIKSNNFSRQNMSNPGDQYIYTILDKTENYYLMSVEMEGVDRYSIFKLYY